MVPLGSQIFCIPCKSYYLLILSLFVFNLFSLFFSIWRPLLSRISHCFLFDSIIFVRKYFSSFFFLSPFQPSFSFSFKLICKYIGTKLDINLFVFVVNAICMYMCIYNIYVIHDACSILRLSMPMYKWAWQECEN